MTQRVERDNGSRLRTLHEWDSTMGCAQPRSLDDVTLNRDRTKAHVNAFLDAWHPRGGVEGWKAIWTARYNGMIQAAIVVGRPNSRIEQRRGTLEINRFAVRPTAPDNVGSWLIGHARRWAKLEGYPEIITYAGVAGAYGTIYNGSGFSVECPSCKHRMESPPKDDKCAVCDQSITVLADGSGWTTHDEDRDTWDDYERRKWVLEL